MPLIAEERRRLRALVILCAFVALGIASLVVSRPDGTIPGQPAGVSDVRTYQAIVGRLGRGEPYYQVVGDELRRRGYATAEPFNWRTPALWMFLARAPRVAGLVLPVAALALVGLTLFLPRASWPAAILAAGMQAGAAVSFVVPEAAVMGEAWAGALIGLSVLGYSHRRTGVGCGLALLALCVRETAAPYCVVATLVAVSNRRWREVTAWMLGAAAYAAYYVWHLTHVWAARSATDIAHASSWLELGGLGFLLGRIQWHAFLFWAPTWAIALTLLLIVAGCCARPAGAHVRLAAASYLVFFLAAGKGFDNYWGLIAWPTWALAVGYGADAAARFARGLIGGGDVADASAVSRSGSL